MPGGDPWEARTPFDRMMDEIAGASSLREVDHLGIEVRRDFAGNPRLGALEAVLAAKRRLLVRAPDGAGPGSLGAVRRAAERRRREGRG